MDDVFLFIISTIKTHIINEINKAVFSLENRSIEI